MKYLRVFEWSVKHPNTFSTSARIILIFHNAVLSKQIILYKCLLKNILDRRLIEIYIQYDVKNQITYIIDFVFLFTVFVWTENLNWLLTPCLHNSIPQTEICLEEKVLNKKLLARIRKQKECLQIFSDYSCTEKYRAIFKTKTRSMWL